ncbi:MAG: VWA domain-containing protein [Pyrinomonadaceae bacterium]|nr:VWA domain-containing protein [Pyrinomonadaceae bacterium]
MASAALFFSSSYAQQTGQPARPRRAVPQTPQPTTINQTSSRPTPTPPASQNDRLPLPPPPPPPSAPTPVASPTPPEGEEVDPNDVIRVSTNLVNLQVRVVDRQNRPINDVRREEFRIAEDGVPQTIELFTKEEVPITYGLLVDHSGSLRNQLPTVVDAGKAIINSNKPGDESFIIGFVDSDQIELKQDFTSNTTALNEALDDFVTEPGQTAVIDAIYVAADALRERRSNTNQEDRRRRALIIVTDGEDRRSTYRQEQLFARLRESDIQIYVIGFVNELDAEDGGIIRKNSRKRAVDFINRLAQETGGRAFFPQTLSEMPTIADQITRDLRTQYVISYNPTNKARDGGYRTVRVTVADAPGKEKRVAVTRPGYTAPRGGESSRPSATQPRNATTAPARPNSNRRTP